MRITCPALVAVAFLAAPAGASPVDRGAPPAAPRAGHAIPAINRAILEGARRWLAHRPRYDPAYHEMPYPGGDVPADRGACVDLVVRALRHAGHDLQRLIHEDRRARPGAYPPRPAPDPNLDPRRCANQVAYMKEHARSLTLRTDPAHLAAWLPGDLVYYGRTRAWHAGIVSDRVSPSGMPYIIDSHQEAGGVSESHLLTRWGAILGHFRLADTAGSEGRGRDGSQEPGRAGGR